MGFIAPAIPYIAQGVGALVGHFAGKKAQKNAMQRSPEEQAALGGAQGAAGQLGQAGQGFLGQSKPWLGQTGNYYSTLLRGNRAAMSQATAAPTAQLTDVYRGATRNLDRSGLQGAQRETAAADLNRDRASKIAGLTTGVQPWAAQQLGNLGTSTGQLGGQLTSNAGSIYRDLLGQGAENRAYAREEGGKTASAIGGMVADLGGMLAGKFGKKGGAGAGTVFTPPDILKQHLPQPPPTAGGGLSSVYTPPNVLKQQMPRAPNAYSLALGN